MELALYDEDSGWVDSLGLQGFGRGSRIRADSLKKTSFFQLLNNEISRSTSIIGYLTSTLCPRAPGGFF
jgi:hypothetical protein